MNKKSDKKIKKKVFKYNEDDILEILTEYLAEANGFATFNARAILLGTPNRDLRLVAIVGEPEDESISKLDLEEFDKNIDFNGSHRPETYIDKEKFLKINPKDML